MYEAGEGAVRKRCVGRQGGQIDENFEEKTKVGVCRQERRVGGGTERRGLVCNSEKCFSVYHCDEVETFVCDFCDAFSVIFGIFCFFLFFFP